MLLCQVKIRTEVFNLDKRRVKQGDRGWTGENEILCNFDSETTHAHDAHVELDEFAHGLHSEGSNLARVEVGVDFRFFVVFHMVRIVGNYYKRFVK